MQEGGENHTNRMEAVNPLPKQIIFTNLVNEVKLTPEDLTFASI